MAVTFRPVQPDDYELVRQFVSNMGWAHRVVDARRFEKMMRNSDRTVVAWHDAEVIGFGRALCDDASNGYLSMVAVAQEFRGQGIGREIVSRLTGDDPEITWVLRGGRKSSRFWERLGFTRSEIAMERTRKP